jgi:hypothetical protein
MKKGLATSWVRILSLVLLMAICSVVLAEIIYKDDGSGEIDIEKTFNQDLYNYFVANGFVSDADLLNNFNDLQTQWFPLVLPGMKLLTQTSGTRYFDPKGFPEEFLKGLLPVEIVGGAVVYPVIVKEDPKTRERIFLNIKGDEIGIADPPDDYDWRAMLLERHPDIYTDAYSKEDVSWLEEMYDPSRIAIRYDLILNDDLIKYVLYLSLLPAPGGGGMMKAYEGGSVTNIQFVEMEVNDGLITMTVAYPNEFADSLEFFACTNLLAQDWVLLATTNINMSTNWIEWTDTDSTNHMIRFYDVWNADADTDADGLSDGKEEHLYGTSPTNSDTDSDGMGDGAEVANGLDPNEPPAGYSEYQGLPFTESFETSSLAMLSGQNRWDASPSNSIFVTNSAAHGGVNAAVLLSSDVPGKVWHNIGADAISAVWIDCWVKFNPSNITYYGDHPYIDDMPAGMPAVFSVSRSGKLYAYDGSSFTWVTDEGTVTAGDYCRFTVNEDFDSGTWSLYTNGICSTTYSNLGFRAFSTVEFSRYSFFGTRIGNTYLDDVAISTNRPF